MLKNSESLPLIFPLLRSLNNFPQHIPKAFKDALLNRRDQLSLELCPLATTDPESFQKLIAPDTLIAEILTSQSKKGSTSTMIANSIWQDPEETTGAVELNNIVSANRERSDADEIPFETLQIK